MAELTDTAREALRAQLKALDDREAALFAERKPIDDKLVEVEEERDQLEVAHETHIAGKCDTCGKVILAGEPGYDYEDGPSFCANHAPTYNQIKCDQDQLIAQNLFEDSYEDGPEAADAARDSVLQHIADGDGDKRCTYPL